MLGELFRGNATGGAVLGELFRAKRPCAGLGGDAAHFRLVAMGGFALHEALLRRVAGVSNPRVVQFPPIGGGAGVVCGGVATKVQTHWVKNGEESLLWLNESTFWRIRPLAWCGIRTRATPPPLRSNVARNSPTTASKAELPSLELQRLQAISKSDRIKLCATFGRGHP